MAIHGHNTKKTKQQLIQELEEIRKKNTRLQDSKKQLQLLLEQLSQQMNLAVGVSQSHSREEVGNQVLETAMRFESIDGGALYQVDRQNKRINLLTHRGLSQKSVNSMARFAKGSFQFLMIMSGKVLYKTITVGGPIPFHEILQKEGLKALAIIPINLEGEIVASLNLYSRSHPEFPSATRISIEALVKSLGGLIARGISRDRPVESREIYRYYIQSLPDAVYLIYNGKFEIMNAHFQNLFGTTLEEMNQPGFDFSRLAAPKSKAMIKQKNNKIAAGEKLDPVYEFTARTGKGEEIDVQEFVTRINYKEGTAVQGIIRNVSTQKQLEQQLLQSQKMEALGKLAGGMAHDFNNMLQAISGYVQLLQKETSIQQNHKYFSEINRVIRRAADLIERLLTFSRISDSELKPVDLNYLVIQTVKILERTIPRMITIKTKLADSLWLIKGNINQLEQALLNLGTNAKDAMSEGGEIVIETENITVCEELYRGQPAMVPGSYILLTFSDTGTGMSRETVTHMFDPFFTTKKIGKGTGLGLSMVHSIISAHRGKITCESEPGRGTIFRIYLPALTVKEQESHPEIPDEQPINGGRETILLVDDEQDILDVSSEILQEYGYNILTADNGQAAIKEFNRKKEQIDLVILDINMPHMSGHVCMRELLKLKPGIKILYASGYLLKNHIRDSLKPGTTEFIAKPYRLEDLLTKVRQILDA